MKPFSAAIVEAGILPANSLAELQRFSPGLELPAAPVDALPLTDAAARLTRVVQEGEDIVIQETDLDAVSIYLKTQRQGVLHIELSGAPDYAVADFPVMYGRTKLGEYIIAWGSTNIADVMVHPETYLMVYPETYLLIDSEKVYFEDVRELYFNDTKAFMVCRARP